MLCTSYANSSESERSISIDGTTSKLIKFKRCVELCAVGIQRTPTGIAEIAAIMQTMNHQKPREELIRILRGHTPDIPVAG